MCTAAELWGRIDAVKVIIRLWMLVRLWVEGTCCHWLRPLPLLLPHMPIPADLRSVQKGRPESWVTFPLTLRREGGFTATTGGLWRIRTVRLSHTKGFDHRDESSPLLNSLHLLFTVYSILLVNKHTGKITSAASDKNSDCAFSSVVQWHIIWMNN